MTFVPNAVLLADDLNNAFAAVNQNIANSIPNVRYAMSTIRPRLHLKKMGATSTPVVAIVGDSTATELVNNPLVPGDNFWGYLRQKLWMDNPSKTFTFNNFAVGGSGWGNLSSQLTAAQAVSPDTLFICTGVNDSWNLQGSAIYGALSTINGWTKVPDIIFVTPKGANPAVPPTNGISAAAYQAGYLTAAGAVRSWAQCGLNFGLTNLPAIGLLDVGRVFQMVANGVDPCSTWMVQNISTPILGITASDYSLPVTPSGDFDVTITIENGAAWQTASGTFSIVVGGLGNSLPGLTIGGNQLNLFSNAGSAAYITYYSGSTSYAPNIFKAVFASGTNTLQVTARGAWLRVTLNGTIFFDGLQPRNAGPFAPRIILAAPPTGATYDIQSYNIGNYMAISQPLPALSVYGGGTSGGNGINHDGSIGISAIDWLACQAADLCAAEAP